MKLFFCFYILLFSVSAGDYPNKVMNLWEGDAPGAKGKDPKKDIPTLKPYWPSQKSANMPAVLLAPGGGYKHHSSIGSYAKERTFNLLY